MKYKAIFFIMVLLSGLNAYGQAIPQGLTWEFTKITRDVHGRKQNENITYFVTPEVTRIEYAHESIYIDYSKHLLYRYNKAGKLCRKFPLISNNGNASTDTEERLKNRNIALISSLKVFTMAERKEVAGYHCSLKHVLFGADLAMGQMVAPLRVSEYDQKFTESMVDYCVSNDVIGLNTLFNVAQKRRDIFKNNPLLRQIDIVGLLEILDGFPVHITHKFRGTNFVTTLLDNPSPTDDKKLLLLPHECHE